MTIDYLIVKTASDTMDAGTLILTEIAIIMSTFSVGVSIVFLIDWFKRRGWVYKHKKKKDVEDL